MTEYVKKTDVLAVCPVIPTAQQVIAAEKDNSIRYADWLRGAAWMAHEYKQRIKALVGKEIKE